jgi:Flp pilus assembly protein TadG
MRGNRNLMGRKAAGRQGERGTVSVEFALLAALVFLPLVAGVLNFSGYLAARRVVAVAAHEGAMRAARGDDVTSSVMAAIASAGLNPDRASVQVNAPVTLDGLGAEVGVRVEYDLSDLTLLPLDKFIPRLAKVEATSVARHL